MEDAPEYTTETDFQRSPPAFSLTKPLRMPAEPAEPITSRFLYVDVAALRAKQLRRGARLRYDVEPGHAGAEEAGTPGDGRSKALPRAVHHPDLEGCRQVRRTGRGLSSLLEAVLGTAVGLVSSTVFVLVLFIGFCVLPASSS